MPPLHEIAHLGHIEVGTPVLDEGVEFFTRYLGMTQIGEAGDSVFHPHGTPPVEVAG